MEFKERNSKDFEVYNKLEEGIQLTKEAELSLSLASTSPFPLCIDTIPGSYNQVSSHKLSPEAYVHNQFDP